MPQPKKAVANGSARFLDLNAARAARTELGAPINVQLGDETFTISGEMPYEVARLSALGDTEGALRELLGGQGELDRFFAERPSLHDVEALIDGVMKFAGLNEGK